MSDANAFISALNLVTADEARALSRITDIDEANALLERYASTVAVLTLDVERASADVSRAETAERAALARLDDVAGVRVRELVGETDRADAAEAECERLRAIVTAVRHERATRAAWLATLPPCASAPREVLDAEAATATALKALDIVTRTP